MNTTEATSIRLRVAPEQKAALEQIAEERDVPMVALLRDNIAAMTGVADPLTRKSKRGSGVPGARRRPRRPTKAREGDSL